MGGNHYRYYGLLFIYCSWISDFLLDGVIILGILRDILYINRCYYHTKYL